MSKVSIKYDKLSQREHVLVRSDTYVGSIETSDESHWIYDDNIYQQHIFTCMGLGIKMRRNMHIYIWKIFFYIFLRFCDLKF